jgi:DNA-binding GntR family transcriptional regulator
VEIDALDQAENRSELELLPLKNIIRQERSWADDPLKSPEQISDLDLRFHEALIGLAGNMVSALLYHTFQYLAQPMVSLFYRVPSVIPFVLNQHSCIVDSLDRHDFSSARSLLKELLLHGEKEILPML